MPNVHTPERQPGESLKDYRERQAASRAEAKSAALSWSTRDGTYHGAKNDRRLVMAKIGQRQYKRHEKAIRRERAMGEA